MENKNSNRWKVYTKNLNNKQAWSKLILSDTQLYIHLKSLAYYRIKWKYLGRSWFKEEMKYKISKYLNMSALHVIKTFDHDSRKNPSTTYRKLKKWLRLGVLVPCELSVLEAARSTQGYTCLMV